MKIKYILTLFCVTLIVTLFLVSCAASSPANSGDGGDNGGGSEPEFTGPFEASSVSTKQCTSSISTLNCFISVWNTENSDDGASATNTIVLPLVSDGTYDFYVNWGDGKEVEKITTASAATHEYATPGEYTVHIAGTIKGWRFFVPNNGYGDAIKLLDVKQWGSLSLGNTDGRQFQGAANFNPSATDEPNLDDTPSLNFAFRDAAKFNGQIGKWDVSQVTTMHALFLNASNFNQDIGDWDVTKVTNMSGMFYNATSFNNNNAPLAWGDRTINVGLTSTMFKNASAFNQDIGDWVVEKVTNMNSMFSGATDFNKNINGWDVSKVESMDNMFSDATSFNNAGEVLEWGTKTSAVTKMGGMFMGASAFNQDISKWDVGAVNNVQEYTIFAMDSALIMTHIPDKFKGNGIVSKEWCTSPEGALKCFVSVWDTRHSGGGASASTKIKLPLVDHGEYNFYVNWGDGSEVEKITEYNAPEATHDYEIADEYTVYITGTIKGWNFSTTDISDRGDAVKILDIKQWGPLSFGKTLGSHFAKAYNFNLTATDAPDLSESTDLNYFFYSASNFNGAIGHWDVSKVTDMTSMFGFGTSFNQDLSEWDVSNVTNMRKMFSGATKFKQNICKWEVDNVVFIDEAKRFFRENYKPPYLFALNSPLEDKHNPFHNDCISTKSK